MNLYRRHTVKLLALALAAGASIGSGMAYAGDGSFRQGRIFTSTNAATGNEVLVYADGAEGLSLITRLPTNGTGTGLGLGSQGAVTLTRDGRYLLVVNAASNTISTFAVTADGLSLSSVVSSGGLGPLSVTEHKGMVYVLNALGEGSVAGFRLDNGMLWPLPGSVRGLSAAAGTNPAQVGFSADGKTLVVTEKGTNRITTYPVGDHGVIGDAIVTPSAGVTPFGFAFDRRNHLLVSEAFGGAVDGSAVSSYRFVDSAPSQPLIISASVGTLQTAACWVTLTPAGHYAFVTNTGSNTVSSYRVRAAGKLELVNSTAGISLEMIGPIDAAVSADGKELYVLGEASGSVTPFAIGPGGTLTASKAAIDLMPGAAGMAAN